MRENTTGGPTASEAASEAESVLPAGAAPGAGGPAGAEEGVLGPSAADTGADVTADAGPRDGTAWAGSTGGEGDGAPGAAQGPDLGDIPVPDEIREAGRLTPDHWLGMVDPAWLGEGEPPEWAIVGRWRSGEDGEIAEWQDNPEYRPSPQALDWPEPEDDVDRAVQLAATGYGPGDAVPRALLDHEVAVLTGPGGGPLAVTTPDGTPVIPVFTSPVYLHTCGRFGYELQRVDEDLLDKVPDGHLLYVNPSGPVSMTVEPAAVREALDALRAPEPAAVPPVP
ncbi:type VII secretion system-associated protein [Streptomyces sp. NBC_00328]|uniref:type VII secretion system-associated protein n=1 Tax=Streptomyces sp. NBC_00328 TaxID=2903646 RepID=UPI002E29F41D|nr:type VII secretion system-associated protein [Streptomyces sp. NBC_00328]